MQKRSILRTIFENFFAKSEKIEVTQIGKIGRKSTKTAFLDAYIGTAIGTYSVGEGYKTAGLGSLTGSVFGAVIVTVLPEIFRSLSEYRMLFYGIAVVLIIMFKPSGLYGYKEFSFKRMVANIKKLVAKITAKSSKGGAANE